jgi:hypothetical protein
MQGRRFFGALHNRTRCWKSESGERKIVKAFITKSSGVNMDHPYFFGIMFRHVAKTEQPCRDVVQVRIGLIWWHIGITWTSGLCTSNRRVRDAANLKQTKRRDEPMQSKNTKSKRTVKRRTSPPGCSVILSAERWKVVCEIMEWSLLEWQKQANPKSAKLLVELMGLPLEIRRQVLEPTQNTMVHQTDSPQHTAPQQ